MTVVTFEQIVKYAELAGSKYPLLVGAQFILESANGSKVSGKNNFFGIKGKGSIVKTSEYINGEWISVYDEFKDYNTPYDCVKDLVEKWYLDYQDYKGVNNAKTIKEAAEMLCSEGYATDPTYNIKLLRLVSENTKMTSNFSLAEAAKYTTGELQHQNNAWLELQKSLTSEQIDKFIAAYRKSDASGGIRFPLKVPYYYQRDSKTGHGERSCQSSAIAMAVEYLYPNAIDGDDDSYLRLVLRYGDTVSQQAQQKALNHLGVPARFVMNGTEEMLLKELDKGHPVPVGILHKGNVSSPTGGGHWVTLTGYNEKYFYVADPYGEMDVVNGGYIKTGPQDGNNTLYTRNNLIKRWLISSSSDGWAWLFG
jgi:hypothetical protein